MQETPNVKPVFIPMLCPVCKGHMTVSYGRLPCKACNSLGYIKVPPKEEGEEDYDVRNR